jgi:hypothetical protein
MSADESRVIQHMNRDHQLALVDYLAVYGNIAPNTINKRSVRLSAIDTEKIVINYVNTEAIPKSITIYFQNAYEDEAVKVSKLGDLRAKLVAMAQYAAAKQGFSAKQVTRITYPKRPSELFMYLIFFTAVYAGTKPREFARKVGPMSMKLLQAVPDFAGPALTQVLTFSLKYGESIFKAMYAIHIAEMLIFTRAFLKKYRVPLHQKIQWYIMNFIEGFFVIKRYNKLIREKEEEH